MGLLLSDGRNVGGFNAHEADQFLLPLGTTDLDYQFTDVGQLAADYGRGLFGEAFHNAQVMRLAKTLAGTPTQGE